MLEISSALNTPESRMNLVWTPEPSNKNKWEAIRQSILQMGKSLVGPDKVYQGGNLVSPDKGQVADEEDRKYLAGGRPFVMMAVSSGEGMVEPDEIIKIPTEELKSPKCFDANAAVYNGPVARCVAKLWRESGEKGIPPIPVSVDEKFRKIPYADGTTEKRKEYYVTVTKRIKGMVGLGAGGPATAIHVLNTRNLPVEEIPKLVATLAKAHIPTAEFEKYLVESNEEKIPEESWGSEENPGCAFRGQEWWYDKAKRDKGIKNDRLEELFNLSRMGTEPTDDLSKQIKDLYDLTFTFQGYDFPKLLEDMVLNNLAIFPHTNGVVEKENEKYVGDLVVANGVVSPSNVHAVINSQTGGTDYVLTSGDRFQRKARRGQMIDWLVASSASSPAHMKTFVKAFKDQLGSDQREMRGLAMHVMYRCISEIPWYVSQGKIIEAERLVELTRDILTGNGKDWHDAWNGVNTDIKETIK